MLSNLLLPLDSHRWSELEQAYGDASGMPELIEKFKSGDFSDDLWQHLWSMLCHQSTVYSATFAAIPHLILAASQNKELLSEDFFAFLANCELNRILEKVPDSLLAESREAYMESLKLIPELASRYLLTHQSYESTSSALSAIAAANGHVHLASVIIGIEQDDMKGILIDYFSR